MSRLRSPTSRVSRAGGVLPWLWTGLVALGTVVLLLAPEGPWLDAFAASEGFVFIPVLFTAMGAVIATRQPGNRVAWLLFYIGFGVLLDGAGSTFVATSPAEVHGMGEVLVLLWNDMGWFITLIYPLILFLYWFPTGSLVSPRWGIGVWLLGVAFVASVVSTIFSETVLGPAGAWEATNPIGLFGSTGTVVADAVVGAMFFLSLAGGVAAMLIRYRTSSDVVRRQIKWVLYALLVFVALLIISLFTGQLANGWVFGVPFVVSVGFIPVSIAIAITRYRLYDIDRLISRTVGYAIIIGVLVGVFTLVAIAPGLLLGGVDGDGTVQEAPPIFVAASTLAVAALFNPLRRGVLRWVDRRFNRSRYDAEQVVEDMIDRLQDDAGLEEIMDGAIEVVAETMQPGALSIWVKE